MDVLESRIARPNQPDHGLYIWPQNIYIAEHLEQFKKAQVSLPLGALARGVIDYEAAESFMESGLHEGVEGLPVIPGNHIPTALRVFERHDYHDNHKVLVAKGPRGIATTLQLRRYYSSKRIAEARDTAQQIGSLTPIMEWINADGYLATRGEDGNLTIKSSPYDRDKDKLDYEGKQWQWQARCKFVIDQGITHVAYRYEGHSDRESDPLPLLVQGYNEPRVIKELGWLKNGVFEPAPSDDPYAGR